MITTPATATPRRTALEFAGAVAVGRRALAACKAKGAARVAEVQREVWRWARLQRVPLALDLANEVVDRLKAEGALR